MTLPLSELNVAIGSLASALGCETSVTVTGLRARGVLFFSKAKLLFVNSPLQAELTVIQSTSDVTGLYYEIGSRIDVMIELLPEARLSRSFVPRLAAGIRWGTVLHPDPGPFSRKPGCGLQ